MTRKPWYWIAPERNRAVARMHNRRVEMWLKDGDVLMYFFRPREKGDEHAPPRVFVERGRTMTAIRLSDEAMRNVIGLWVSMQDGPVQLPFIDQTKPNNP